MKQEPGNASSQESPGFSRGEEVKDIINAEVRRGAAEVISDILGRPL